MMMVMEIIAAYRGLEQPRMQSNLRLKKAEHLENKKIVTRGPNNLDLAYCVACRFSLKTVKELSG